MDPPAEETGLSPRRRFQTLPEGLAEATRLIHAGHRPDLNAGALVEPIYQTSTYRFPAEYSESRRDGGVYLYTRHGNPTQELAAEVVRELEGAGSARVFSSGMAAIATTFLTMANPGDEVLAIESLYGGTIDLLTGLLTRFGLRVRFVSDAEAAEPEACLRPSTRLVYLETPTNPTLRVLDLRRWATAARSVGAVSIVDNTFATPILQRPLAAGIDVVVHSATKYLGGHSDLVGGVVAGPAPLVDRIRASQIVLGGVLDPFAGFLLVRGLKTLAVRVEQQSRAASDLVDRLAGHPRVERVCYAGRGSTEEEATARRQMRGRGGVVTFTVAGGRSGAERFLQRLRLVQVASSLGGVESLVSVPRNTSHVHLSAEERARRGIDDGMVRLSVGLEDVEDLWRDLRSALET